MFEKILQKILVSYFGRFISGLDKNNLKLGVWTGNVVIENVNLKSELIQMLELPFKLKQSSVGRMIFKIPWKNLSSQPVEITIENVNLTVNPMLPQEWDFSDQVIIEKKFQLLLDYCKQCMKKKKKKKEDEQGYLDKMTIKVIDNIQLTIVNIHFRYEQPKTPIQQPFSWGFTLQSLLITTADQNWNKCYIDRTESNNKFEMVNKLFALSNFGWYWNAFDDKVIEAKHLDNDYEVYMGKRIYRSGTSVAQELSKFIILINAGVKVVQNSATKVYLPLIDVIAELDVLNVVMKQDQFQQLVKLMETMQLYSKLLWVQRKNVALISSELSMEYEQQFSKLLPIIYLSEEKSMGVLEEKDQEMFKQILRSVQYGEILRWVENSSKSMMKEMKVNELTQNKNKDKWWKKKKEKEKEGQELTEEEIRKIDQEIEKIFSNEVSSKKESVRPNDSIGLRVEFNLVGGSLSIENSLKEGIKFGFDQLMLVYEEYENKDIGSNFSLNNINLILVDETRQSGFCYRRQQKNAQKFLNLIFEKRKGQEVDAKILTQIQPLECIYNNEFMNRLNKFLYIDKVEDEFKMAALNKLELVQDKTSNKIENVLFSQYKFMVQVDIASPILILPFSKYQANSECWVVNLGNLNIRSNEDAVNYQLKLDQVSFKYFQDMNQYYTADQKGFEVIQEMNLDLDLIKQDVLFLVRGQLPPLNIMIDEYLQLKLFNISDILFSEVQEDQKIEMIQKEKENILKMSQISDHLIKDGVKYYAIVSGYYIYLFREQNDSQYSEYISLRNVNVQEKDKNSLLIKSKKHGVELQFESSERREKWKQILIQEEKEIEQEEQVSELLRLDLGLSTVKFIYQKNYHIELSDIKLLRQQKQWEIKLKEVTFDDCLYTYNNKEYQNFMRGLSKEDGGYFLRYVSGENQLIELDEVLLNWKADIIMKLINLFDIHYEDEIKDEEIELRQKGYNKEEIRERRLHGLCERQQSIVEDQTEYQYGEDIYKLDECRKSQHLFHDDVGKHLKLLQTRTIRVRHAKVNLINYQTHVNVGYLLVSGMEVTRQITPLATFQSGSIGSFGVYDVTNYPSTINTDLNPQLIRESVIVESSCRIQYDLAMYSKEFIKGQVTSFYRFSLDGLVAHYQHQVAMRLINYLQIQVFTLLTMPGYLTMNQHYHTHKQVKLVYGSIDQLYSLFMHPTFHRIQLYSNQPVVILTQGAHTLTTNLDHIRVDSRQAKCQKRILKQSQVSIDCWCDLFDITFRNANVALDGQVISNPISFQLQFEKVLYYYEIMEVFPDTSLSKYYQIKSLFESPLQFRLNQAQYQSINAILLHNFTMDDMQDHLFIHDHHIYCNFAPNEIQSIFYIPSATLNLDDVIAILNDIQLEYFLSSDQTQNIKLYSSRIDLTRQATCIIGHFQEQPMKQQQKTEKLEQLKFVTNLTSYQRRKSSMEQSKLLLESANKDILLDLLIYNNSNKELLVTFSSITVRSEMSFVLSLLDCLRLEESCYPTASDPTSLAVVISVMNALVYFPSSTTNVLSSQGYINYIYNSQKDAPVLHKVTFSNFELFISSLEELQTRPYGEVSKRQILLPLHLYFSLNEDPCMRQVDVSLDRTSIKLSNDDLSTMLHTYLLQKQSLDAYWDHQQEKDALKQSFQSMKCNANLKLNEDFTNYTLNMTEFQLVLIQGVDHPVPVFDFTLKNGQIQYTSKLSQMLFGLQALAQSQFYNKDIAMWEPFVEPLILQMDFTYNLNGNPKTASSIQVNPTMELPCNINLTVPTLLRLYDLLTIWQNSILLLHDKTASTAKISRDSPYMLLNHTGHTIQAVSRTRTFSSFAKNQSKPFTTTVKNNEQCGITYLSDSVFEAHNSYLIERRKLDLKFMNEKCQFSDIYHMDFDKLETRRLSLQKVLGEKSSKIEMLVQLRLTKYYKLLEVSSIYLLQNRTHSPVLMFLVDKYEQSWNYSKTFMPEEEAYLPLGFDQSIIQFKYQGEKEFLSYIDFEKVKEQKQETSFDLTPNSTNNMILLVRQEPICTRLVLQCPFVLKNTLPVEVELATSKRIYKIAAFSSLKIPDVHQSHGLFFRMRFLQMDWSPGMQIFHQGPKGCFSQMSNGLKVRVIYIGQEQGFFTFLIESEMVVENTLSRVLYYHAHYEGKAYLCGASDTTTIINECDELSFQFDKQQSLPLTVALGRYLVRVPLKDGYMDTVVDVRNVIVETYTQLQSKWVSIQPRIVLVNHFGQPLRIRQQQYSGNEIVLHKEERMPFFWFSSQHPKYIQLYYEDHDDILLSGYVGMDAQGTLFLPIRRIKDGSIREYMIISIKEIKKTQYFVMQRDANQKPFYRIQNNLLGYELHASQDCSSLMSLHAKSIVPPQKESDFAFDHPTHDKLLNFELVQHQNQKLMATIQVDLTETNQRKQINVQLSNGNLKEVFLSSYFSLIQRQIVISVSDIKQVDEEFDQDNLSTQVNVCIPLLNVSVISQSRQEVILVSMNEIDFVIIRNKFLETSQLRVNKLQVDSNSQLFPVLLTMSHPEEMAKKKIPFLNVVVQRAHKVTFVQYFKQFLFCIQKSTLKVSEGTMEELYEIYLQFKNDQIVSHKLGQQEQQRQLADAKLNHWQHQNLKEQILCFFETIEIYPIVISLTFQKQETKSQQFFLKTLAGQAFINCDEAPIKLNGVKIMNCLQSQDNLLDLLKNKYQDQFTMNMIKIIGSIEILGNPMGLLNNLGQGIYDLYDMPREGFVKGPLEGGLGVVLGVGSLTKGVVSGALNSVQKITGSLASGISALSFDSEYQQDRIKASNRRPKHLVDGIGYGVISLFTGVGEGLVGLVSQPVKGAEKDGVEGFLKGTLKGLSGLIVKPVVGAIDLTSKTAEGMKNTARYFDDKPSERKCRPARAFYSRERFIRRYLLQDAEIVVLLRKVLGREVQLVDSYSYARKEKVFVIVVTVEEVLGLEAKGKSVVLQVESGNIKGVERCGKQLNIYVHGDKVVCRDKGRDGGIVRCQEGVSIVEEAVVERVEEKIKYLLQLTHEC